MFPSDAEKAFGNNPVPVCGKKKKINDLKIDGSFLSLVKNIYEKSIAKNHA